MFPLLLHDHTSCIMNRRDESMCVCVSLPSSDSAICEWSPVQYPVYSLCETGSQRDGEIAEVSSKYKIY